MVMIVILFNNLIYGKIDLIGVLGLRMIFVLRLVLWIWLIRWNVRLFKIFVCI